MVGTQMCVRCGERLFLSEFELCRPCDNRQRAREALAYAKRGLRVVDEAKRRLEVWRNSE